MGQAFIHTFITIIVLIGLSIPLGIYIKKILCLEEIRGLGFLRPVESTIYRLIGVDPKKDMNRKQYTMSVLSFSFVSFVLLMFMLLNQHWLPLNGEDVPAMSWSLAFNTAISYVTNTNWQAYAGENTLSIFSQMFGLTVQNFLSAATGIAVLTVLIKGLVGRYKNGLGNYWQDMVRINLYILLPLSFFVSLILISQGVVQTFQTSIQVSGLESGKGIMMTLGTVASQVAIKQLGTNGGGYYGANSAHPFENPTVISNFVETLSILIIPAALIVAFGLMVKDWKQARTIYIVSTVFLVMGIIGVIGSEYYGPVYESVLGNANLEGKEVRFGIDWSSIWSVSTTAVANGSVNSSLTSYMPLGGLIPLFFMQLGEIIFGGAGTGLYGMLTFILLTVFIAGLLVGRTPEFLGKKIEPFDMKMASLVVLTPILVSIFGMMLTVSQPDIWHWLGHRGAHGFTEIMYAMTSLANNNGSAFSSLEANQTFLNVLGGLMMLFSRFIPIIAIILLANNMLKKKVSAVNSGTLSTTSTTFTVMLMIVILLISALSFFPMLALGPIAEFFN